jgi:hypothetical protein
MSELLIDEFKFYLLIYKVLVSNVCNQFSDITDSFKAYLLQFGQSPFLVNQFFMHLLKVKLDIISSTFHGKYDHSLRF